MARIILPAGTLVGRKLLNLNAQIIQASQDASRLKSIVDQITATGANCTALEGAGEACFPSGSGTTIYAGIVQIKTSLDGLASLVSVIDQG